MSDRLKPRVAFWSPCLHRAGGTERWHASLIEHLDRTRVEVLGLAVLDPAECDDWHAHKIAEITPVTTGPDACTALARQVDILVAWGLGDLHELLPPRGEGRPVVVFVSHGDGSSLWSQVSCAAAAPDTDHFVAVSQAALGPIPADRRAGATVLANGVDPKTVLPTLTREAQRAAWGLPRPRSGGEPLRVLGYLGRLSGEKDPYAVARAIAHLPREWAGVLVGDGDEASQCRADSFVQAPGRLFFPGPTTDIGSALSAMDVVLVPSLQEGFGLTIAEGICAGRPVVTTPVGIAADGDLVFHGNLNLWGIACGARGEDIAETVKIAWEAGKLGCWAGLPEEWTVNAFARRWEAFFERVWVEAHSTKREQPPCTV
jgi:glycosyltransferase involved in cell wall biosynthesis